MTSTRIGQIALVVSDIKRSTRFYARAFGLDPVLGTRAFRGRTAGEVQGLDNPAARTFWLRDSRQPFQLELFQYEHPCSRPLREDQDVSDIGYNRLLVAVRSMAETLQALESTGQPATPLEQSGRNGIARHAVVRDPDGITLELVEMPERILDGRPARLLGLGISVVDLGTSVEDM
ncbi:MAG: VOC family protein, partial [Thiohalobacterales bacterium]|nr:VOC family protein [Thiohalobacterales bacterium]